MHFDEDIHTKLVSGGFQIGSFRIIERRHYEEDADRAKRARLHHLIGIDHEILAKDGERHRRPRRNEILIRALEIGNVRQHRKAGRAALGIGFGEQRRIEIIADHAFRGRGFLDLRDQAVVAVRKLCFKRPDKAARGVLCFRAGFLFGERQAAFLCAHMLALVIADFGENAHAAAPASLEMRVSVSKAFRAAPLSMERRASSIPSATRSHLPPIMMATPAFRSVTSRYAPAAPLRTAISASAFSSGAPPFSASSGTRGKPNSSGVISNSRISPAFISTTCEGPVVESSSSPSAPCMTQICTEPSSRSVSAIGRIQAGS